MQEQLEKKPCNSHLAWLVAILQLVGLVPGFSDHPGMNMSIWDGGRLSTLVGTCEQHEIVMQRSKSV